MEYKEKIHELINMIDDEKFLKRIYIIVSDYIKKKSE